MSAKQDHVAPGPHIPAPLDQASSSLWDYAASLVVERGIELKRSGDTWQYWSKGDMKSAPLDYFTRKLGLSVVRMTIKTTDGLDCHFTPAATQHRPVLEMQVQSLQQAVISVDLQYRRDVLHMSYIAEATTYHCRQLIAQYRAALNLATLGGSNLNPFSDDFALSGAVTPYFELEALVTAAVRSFDTARFAIWKAFGTESSTPNNFERTVTLCKLPNTLQSTFHHALATYKRAKGYRDCIQHYAHFGARLPFVRIQLLDNAVWSALAMLPDNPEVRSYDRFVYDGRLDALSYGWHLADSVAMYLNEIVSALNPQTDS